MRVVYDVAVWSSKTWDISSVCVGLRRALLDYPRKAAVAEAGSGMVEDVCLALHIDLKKEFSLPAFAISPQPTGWWDSNPQQKRLPSQKNYEAVFKTGSRAGD